MPDVRVETSLAGIRPEAWNACFSREIENYEYLLATENAGLKGFALRYLTVWKQETLVAAMPFFMSDYALDTTLQGAGKKITNAIKSAFPNLLTIKMACLGSPCTEACVAGFHPQNSVMENAVHARAMLAAFEAYANEQQCKLMSVKDIPESVDPLWNPALAAKGYASLPGMPTAVLNLDFASEEDYFAMLSHATRKDMRRKLKHAAAVRIEYTDALDAALPAIFKLYLDTKNRSDWQFEELTENYFREVLLRMPGRAFCTLYYAENELLAANLLLHDDHTLIDKFFCMDSARGREYNLYFLSWFTNIRYCLEHGLKCYQSGQANYDNKIRLGSRLIRNTMHFKHRNAIAQKILKLASPFLGADETLPSQEAA